MYRCLTSKVILASLALSISTSFAATVSWQSSASGALWVDKGALQTTAWDNDNTKYISVNEQTTYREYDGHGGCINEVGWKVLSMIPQSTRDSVIKLLFDSLNGCNFNICRMPLGANDYSLSGYSLNENKGDYAMDKFSIDRDKQYHIPFIKAAMAVQPGLKMWGSPWSPPTWLKTSGSFTSGSIKADAQSFTAYALYFAKAVKAYQQEGVHYVAVHPQNEPFWGGGAYPVCQWEGSQMRDFIKSYLGPRFKNDDINAEIWMGTLNGADDGGTRKVSQDVMFDSIANSYCTGAGYQYSVDGLKWTADVYPDKRLMETETPCGGDISGNTLASNDWGYAEGNDNTMREHYLGGANSYMQWNIVLDREGRNWGRWSQCVMISVDTVSKKVTFNPQFYQVRHYSYIKPGAYRIATTGNFTSVVAFRNPNGENVLIATNSGGSSATVAINFNGQKIKPTLPAHSFNTFRTAGTPIPAVSPFSKIEAEKFAQQSGTLIRACSDGGSGVTLISNNDWTEYHNIDFGNGAATFEARVSGAAGGTIEVHIDSCNGPAAGTCTVGASAAWSTVSCPVTGVSGKHKLFLKFKGAGTGKLFDFNWFDFTPGTSALRTAQQSASTENRTRIVLCNSLTLPVSAAAFKKSGAVSIYNISGKVVYTAQNRNAISRIADAKLRRGIYIVKEIGR
jgi:glucosylceramidase